MRKLLLTVVVLLFFYALRAQTGENFRITGKVTDSLTGLPLEYASLSLMVAGNKTPVRGATSDQEGHFTISQLKPGTYTMVIDFIGYRTHAIKNIAVSKTKPVAELKTVTLSKNQEMMQGVVVTAQGKLIENKIDKMVFNAERDLTSQSGVATDILKKVPQVSVDVDGNVELSGSSSIRFLINGKPSSAFGSNIADVLQSIPASQIKSIEVVTNPGAKYDAQGTGGIINIILKKNNAQGINGNVSLAAGTRTQNGSLNLNVRHGNFGVNAFVSANDRPNANSPSSSDRNSIDSIQNSKELLRQVSNRAFHRHGLEAGLGFDWTYKKRNNFSGSLNFDQFGNTGSGQTNQLQSVTDATGSMISQLESVGYMRTQYKSHNIDANLTYKKTFAKQDQELEIIASSSFGNSFSSGDNELSALPQDSLYYGTRNQNPGTQHESQIELNYAQPLKKKMILGTGGKVSISDINSNSDILSFQPTLQEYSPNLSLSNSLNYHQKVYAVYGELGFPVGELFDAKMGGRYERTSISSFYSNAQKPYGSSGYNTFVPSIYFSRKIGDHQTIKLSYSKRIQRPNYWDLNPFINTVDPKNITSGNPALKPEIGNRFELGYNNDISNVGSFMVSLFYRGNNQDIQPYTIYYPSLKVGDSTYTNISVSTRENIGLEQNIGVNLYADVHVMKKLTVRSNVFLFHRHITNTIDPGYNATSFNYRFNINTTYSFNNTFSGEFFGNFNSPRNEVQGRYPSFTSYSFAFRKQVLNKKGSVAFTATNPFSEYINQETKVYGPGFTLTSNRKIPFRSFGINVTWKFGRLEFKKDKEEPGSNLNASAE